MKSVKRERLPFVYQSFSKPYKLLFSCITSIIIILIRATLMTTIWKWGVQWVGNEFTRCPLHSNPCFRLKETSGIIATTNTLQNTQLNRQVVTRKQKVQDKNMLSLIIHQETERSLTAEAAWEAALQYDQNGQRKQDDVISWNVQHLSVTLNYFYKFFFFFFRRNCQEVRMVAGTVQSQLEGSRVKSQLRPCSPHACTGFHRILWLPPTAQRHTC